jgi:hypothetical protein
MRAPGRISVSMGQWIVQSALAIGQMGPIEAPRDRTSYASEDHAQ